MRSPTPDLTRAEQLRRQYRRILGWSVVVAIVVHAGIFVMSPDWEIPRFASVEPQFVDDEEFVPALALIDATFGPPLIRLPDGTIRQEPPNRVLEAKEVDLRGVRWSTECHWVLTEDFGSVDGEVRLEVGEFGLVSRARISRSSGDGCLDQLLVAVAGTLWYRWLPRADAEAPVDLVQPIRVQLAV